MKRFYLCIAIFGCIHFAIGQQMVIPVVFHILHLGGPENISDAQVLDAMRILNNDYNKLNQDTLNIDPSFINVAGSMDITFRLANIDPNGNCTNGIEHIFSNATNATGEGSKIHDWPRDKYLNIWVLKNLLNGAAAYTYFPWQADTAPFFDGIGVQNNYVGSIGSANLFTSRALTQLSGNYFGLLNTNGYGFGQVCGDDSVSDTPLTKGWLYCPSIAQAKVCDTSVIENYQNFMDNSGCTCMFTKGQVQRVHTYLNKPLAQRNNLGTSSNLTATGTNVSIPTACAPVADFHANQQYICLGSADVLTDDSYNGTVANRLWTFQNAGISTSTDSSVSVDFNTPGWHNVTLMVSNGQGSSTITKKSVFVYDTAVTLSYPYSYDFEDTGQFYSNWASLNPDADTPAFQLTNSAGYGDKASVVLNNYYSRIDGGLDELISPAFNLTGITNPNDTLSFWYTYATRPVHGDAYDSISVLASSNCGNSWISIYRNASENPSFAQSGVDAGYYIPSSNAALWQKIAVRIPVYLAKPQVHFMIRMWGTTRSNNFYIDDFTIGPPIAGIESVARLTLAIIPNPFSSDVTIAGLSDAPCNVLVTDIAGREIASFAMLQPIAGRLKLDLPVTLPQGVYLLKISDGSLVGTAKLVKQ